MAGLCVGIPLLLGLLFGDIEAGKIGSIGALVILYTQSGKLVNRMMILTVCGFGFIFSFTIGLVFSFAEWLTPLILGLYTFAVHYSLNRLALTRPPGNFFFIMVASIAIALPHNSVDIARNIGYFAIGVMIACGIGLLYSMLTLRRVSDLAHSAVQYHHIGDCRQYFTPPNNRRISSGEKLRNSGCLYHHADHFSG